MSKPHSDRPSSCVDLLHYNKYAKALSNLILEADTPFTIWISWEWWYWKTTLMNFISYYLDTEKYNTIPSLEKEKIDFKEQIDDFHKMIVTKNTIKQKNKEKELRFATIFLNAWPFINSKDIWTAIFEQIMLDLIKMIKSDNNWYQESWKFLLKAIWWFIKTVKLSWKINLWAGEIWGEFDPSKFSMDDIFSDNLNYSNFKSEIETILVEIIKNKWKLVIFIDDLDRLYPKQALEVMLFIKNFLDTEWCIFLIWSDNKVLEDWLKELFWKNRSDIKELEKKFFEKIYQLEFKLPQLQKKDLRKYLEWFTEIECLISGNEANYDEVLNFFFSLTSNLNPRKIKRTVNVFKLLKNLIQADSKYDLLLLEIAIIYEKDIELYNNIKDVVFEKTIDWIRIELDSFFENKKESIIYNYIIRKDQILVQILNIFWSSDVLNIDTKDVFDNLIDNLSNSSSFASARSNLGNLLEFINANNQAFKKADIAKILNWIFDNDWWNWINQILKWIGDISFNELLSVLFKNITSDYYDLLDILRKLKSRLDENYWKTFPKTIQKLTEVIDQINIEIPF